VCSIDKAEQIGLNWWRSDPRLSSSAANAGQLDSGAADRIAARLGALEQQLASIQSALPRAAKSK
jgi:hypothetical protein